MEVVEQLPNNYQNALDRAMTMRRSALKNPELKKTLIDNFGELIDEEWIIPVEVDSISKPMCFLPFFVTKQEKALVVYDGAAVYKGMCLNNAVLSGINLLNNLVEVLTRFRLGRIHCVHPQVRKGRDIVRRATVAVLAKNPDSGKTEIRYILRDLSKIAPV